MIFKKIILHFKNLSIIVWCYSKLSSSVENGVIENIYFCNQLPKIGEAILSGNTHSWHFGYITIWPPGYVIVY